MARVTPVSGGNASWSLRVTYWFTRRAIARLTGRRSERMIEPIEIYARVPRLLRGYASLERATGGLSALPDRLRALAELRAATLTACEYCIDLGSSVARRWGLSDEEIREMPGYRSSPLFAEVDRLVLDYATGMSRTPVEVPEGLVEELRGRLSDVQLIELTHVIALENLRGRFNRALGVGSAGFSEGSVCADPVSAGGTGGPP